MTANRPPMIRLRSLLFYAGLSLATVVYVVIAVVILPLPFFFNHHMWLAMQGIEPRLFESSGGPGDAERAEALVDERTRAIVLVSPDNPTGIVRTPETILALYEMAERRGIALVLDETYKDFRGFAAPAHPLFAQPRWRDTFVHLYSFSKAFALTGYRVGAVAAAPRLIGSHPCRRIRRDVRSRRRRDCRRYSHQAGRYRAFDHQHPFTADVGRESARNRTRLVGEQSVLKPKTK